GNGADVALGGSGDDSIVVGGSDASRDIVVGDNGSASFDAAGVLVAISTLVPGTGGNDDILVGDGADVGFGGVGSDYISVTRGTGVAVTGDTGDDVLVGDNGSATFVNGVLAAIQTSEASIGN